MDGDELARLARRQHGLVTLGQARAAGLSSHQVRHRVRNGQWTALRRGVFLASSTPRSWPQAVLAACLAVPGPCWASHRTAAALWDLPVERGNAIHVTTPAGARVRLEGVRHHRSERLDASDVGLRHGIPVTSCARTLVDCLPWLPEGRLGRVVDAARRSGALAIEDLAAAVARLDDGGGRRPIVPLRRIVADRCTGAPAESDGERWVAVVLVAAGLPPPVAQHEVVVEGRRRRLDLAYPDHRLAIEYDGFLDHGLNRTRFDDDRARNNALVAAGWIVLHFTSSSTADAVALRGRESA